MAQIIDLARAHALKAIAGALLLGLILGAAL